MITETDRPCALCAVNPWTDCRHRKGLPRPDLPDIPPDTRGDERHGHTGLGGLFTTPGSGLAFKTRKRRHD
jgi:hypothetical protein